MKEGEIKLKRAEHEIQEDAMSNSWKDEFLVIVFTLPIWVVFIEAFINPDVSMKGAMKALQAMPEWYQNVLFILVLVVFGLKTIVVKFADKMLGTKPKDEEKK